jgi:hypothetical protein
MEDHLTYRDIVPEQMLPSFTVLRCSQMPGLEHTSYLVYQTYAFGEAGECDSPGCRLLPYVWTSQDAVKNGRVFSSDIY